MDSFRTGFALGGQTGHGLATDGCEIAVEDVERLPSEQELKFGTWPRWRRDGKEIFFGSSGKIMAAEVKASGPRFEVGTIRQLFEARLHRGGGAPFDVTADGQRFVFVEENGETNTAITLFVNWDAQLKEK